jgi:rubrerythrin
MALSSFLIVLVIFILAGFVIIRPFLVEVDTRGTTLPRKNDSLLAEKERLLSSIEDLDLEYDLKKISSREHTRNRDILLSQAAEVLMKLDKLEKTAPVEKRISSAPSGEDDLEKMIKARRRELKGEKSSYCSHCGKTVKPDDQFCGQCGEKL